MSRLFYLSLIFHRLTLESESKKNEQQNCASPSTAMSSKNEIIQNGHCERFHLFEIKIKQEESSMSSPSFYKGIRCDSQHFEIEPQQEESLISIPSFYKGMPCNSQRFEIKSERKDSSISTPSSYNGMPCNSQRFEIKPEQEETAISTASFSKSMQWNSPGFEIKPEQEEFKSNTHSFSNGMKCNLQKLEINPEEESTTIRTAFFSDDMKFNSQLFGIKPEEESTIRTASFSNGIKFNSQPFGIKSARKESSISTPSSYNDMPCNSQRFEIKPEQEESTIDTASFSKSIQWNSQRFEIKPEQEEFQISTASITNNIKCNSQYFETKPEQKESTIRTASISNGIKCNSSRFEIKPDQEESTISSASCSIGIECNSQLFEQDTQNEIKSLKRKCPGPEFIEHSLPNSSASSTISTQYSEDSESKYPIITEVPKNNSTVNDHDQHIDRYMWPDKHIDGKSDTRSSIDHLNIPEPSSLFSQKYIPDHTTSYTCPLGRIIIQKAISPKKGPTDTVDIPNARDNDEIRRSRKRYGHETSCDMKVHNNFEIKNKFNLNKRSKKDPEDISCTYHRTSESRPEQRIQSITNPDTSYIKQPIPLEYLGGPDKDSVRTENAVQGEVTNFNPRDIKKKQDGANDPAEYNHSINSISLTDTSSRSSDDTLDLENFLLTTKILSLLQSANPGFDLLRLSFEEISIRYGKKSNIYNKHDTLSNYPEISKAYKEETTFFLFGLYSRFTLYRVCSGRTVIIIPMSCQGFYQYNHLLELESNIIIKCEEHIIITVEIICTGTEIRLTRGGRHRKIQIVLPADEQYRDFLKNLVLIKHGGQRLMMECRYITDSQLRFTVYRPQPDEILKAHLRFSSFISESKVFIKQAISKYSESTTVSGPSPRNPEVSVSLMKGRGQINNQSISECSDNDNSPIVERKTRIRDGKEGFTDHHNHSIVLTFSIEDLSDQETMNLLEDSFPLTGEAIDRLWKNYPKTYLFEFSLEEFSDKSSMKGGFFAYKEFLEEYPRNRLPGHLPNVFILYALFDINPLDAGNTGKSPIIMPVTYQGFVQYNHLCQLRSKFICTFDKYFVIDFNVTFIRQALPISKIRKYRAVFILPAEEEHLNFLKDIFFIMHAGQRLIMYLRIIRNHELWFSVYKAPSSESLKSLLEDSRIISQGLKYADYLRGKERRTRKTIA